MKLFFKFMLVGLGVIITHSMQAQTDPSNPQIICEGDVKNYQVDFTENGGAGTLGSTYAWTVTTGGFVGSVLTNQGPAGSSNRIQINWGSTPPGDYELTVLETNDGCPGTPVTLTIRIQPRQTPLFDPIGPFCQNSTAPVLPEVSNNGITGTWLPANINTATVGTLPYTFTPAAGQCAVSSVSVDVTIDTEITPTFAPLPAICEGGSAPALPAVSVNGISGTWNPVAIDASVAGTNTYTFNPASGQCAVPVGLSVTIDPRQTPVFDPIANLCEGGTAPALPGTSNNGIVGTWVPSIINVSAPGSTTYIFTPDAAACATQGSIDVTVDSRTTPLFDAIGPLCEGATAPALPATSTNGVIGTWSPATISTAAAGTTTYTFAPAAGECASPTSLAITIDAPVVPAFGGIAPLCLNATAPALPAVSTNGISGTWSPSTINTATAGTSTYTFTPAGGQCAGTTSLDVTITDEITPTFDPIGPFCQNTTAPALPGTSNNGITGTWSPASINTGAIGTSSYTFTPDAGQCAATVSIDVTIDTEITPTFAAIPSVCVGATAPTLPAVSANGITGSWSPAVIDASAEGTTTYTFTPDLGQCAGPASIDYTVNPLPVVTVNPDAAICEGASITLNANGAIDYTWTPVDGLTPAVGTPVVAAPAVTTTYTVTGIDANGCSSSAQTTITVNPIPVTSPIFHD